MISLEDSETIAQDLLHVAGEIGKIINQVEVMAKEGWQAINDESDAYEMIVLEGETISHNMRMLAMRLDRAAYAKNPLTPHSSRAAIAASCQCRSYFSRTGVHADVCPLYTPPA